MSKRFIFHTHSFSLWHLYLTVYFSKANHFEVFQSIFYFILKCIPFSVENKLQNSIGKYLDVSLYIFYYSLIIVNNEFSIVQCME